MIPCRCCEAGDAVAAHERRPQTVRVADEGVAEAPLAAEIERRGLAALRRI